MLSRYLTRNEFSCNCDDPDCPKLPPDLDAIYYQVLFHNYDMVRSDWGALPVRSGWRCPYWNEKVGGSSISAHMFGALDCDVMTDQDVDELFQIIVDINPDLRIGTYYGGKTFIHIDNAYMITPRATDKWRRGARWTKRYRSTP